MVPSMPMSTPSLDGVVTTSTPLVSPRAVSAVIV
jgi:hypothetical protein